LLEELEKPKSQQSLTVDQVLEATTAAALLKKRKIVDDVGEDSLRKAIIAKYRTGVIVNTVAPRKLARLARAVQRDEVTLGTARNVVRKLIRVNDYDIDEAFRDSVEQIDFEHGIEQQIERLLQLIEQHRERNYVISAALAERLRTLSREVRGLLS